ncbi:MAG: class I SAM-dependent methyltransferase [FCB group bacterium]|jgi:SAM-dependent methyltransferase|nr:class I SAM-dependent methyltransferase [FCB group bacterium]
MNEEEKTVSHDWYRHAFDALYPVIYAHRTVEAAQPEATFAAEVLSLTRDHTVLDVACGNGRHLAHLRKRTLRAVGLDYSGKLLELARVSLGGSAALVRADMRAIPFCEAFDVVTNFFTSFGYFFSEEENLKTVRSVAGALKPGGRFFIDYMSRAHVEANLVPRSRRHEGQWEIEESRWIDAGAGRINKHTTVYREGTAQGGLEESVQLYTLDELSGLLKAGGLCVERVYGDFTGVDYGPTQPRMILVGRKAQS